MRQALLNLDSIPAPAGEMDVVLGAGWPGVMLHEAVGHGLEGDFNRKKTSAFAGLMGQQVAAKGVTVVDDGTIQSRRGSLSIDDEGTPTNRTVLIEDGILVGYMQDRQNARLMDMKPTGNGRRESHAHVPMPRMTNTYMTAGDRDPAEIIASVKNGVYCVNLGGGQVDITSGKYVFNVTEAYKIENGKLGAPLKGAMLIGNGPTDLKRVNMVGNDMKLDTGVGTCGKNGQGVPVGVGQPTLADGPHHGRRDGLSAAERRVISHPPIVHSFAHSHEAYATLFLAAFLEAVPIVRFVHSRLDHHPQPQCLDPCRRSTVSPRVLAAAISGAMIGDGLAYLLGHRYPHRHAQGLAVEQISGGRRTQRSVLQQIRQRCGIPGALPAAGAGVRADHRGRLGHDAAPIFHDQHRGNPDAGRPRM